MTLVSAALIGVGIGFLGGLLGKGGSAIATPLLHAIGIPRGQNLEAETATAFVVARPNAEGRRMLRPGFA